MNIKRLMKPFLYSQLLLSLVVVLLCTLLSSTISHQTLRENMAAVVIKNNEKVLSGYTDVLNRLIFSSAQEFYLRVSLGPINAGSSITPNLLSYFSRNPLSGHLTDTLSVRNHLQNLCISNEYFSRIEIFYPENNLLISDDDIYYDLIHADRVEKMQMQTDWYQRFLREGVREGFYSASDDTNVMMIRPLLRGSKIQSVIFLYYDKASLQRTLEELLPAETEAFLLFNEEGVLLLSLHTADVENAQLLKELPPEAREGGSFETGTGSEMRLHSVRRDVDSGWYYIVSSLQNPYVQASSYITGNLLFSGAVTLAVGFFLILLLCSHNARPLQALLRLCARSDLTPANERDAYRFISGTLANTLHGLDAAQRENSNISGLLRHQYAQWLLAELSAGGQHSGEVGDALRFGETGFPRRYFCVVAAACGNQCAAEGGEPMEQLFSIFTKAFNPGDGTLLGGFGSHERVLLGIVNFDNPEDFHGVCGRLSRRGLMDLTFYFTTGGICGGLGEAAGAAGKTLSFLDAGYLFPERVWTPDPEPFSSPEELKSAQRALFTALQNKNPARAAAALDIWARQLRAQGRPSAAAAAVEELRAQLAGTAALDGTQTAALRDIFRGHASIPVLWDDLARWLTDWAVQEEQNTGDARLIQGARDCVAVHLTNPQLSLSFVAEFMGVSASHLSRAFPRHCGLTFMEYVSSEKLENARNQLLHTDRSMQEIAESLGYSSPQYFISLYKRRYGVTPAAFRRLENSPASPAEQKTGVF